MISEKATKTLRGVRGSSYVLTYTEKMTNIEKVVDITLYVKLIERTIKYLSMRYISLLIVHVNIGCLKFINELMVLHTF